MPAPLADAESGLIAFGEGNIVGGEDVHRIGKPGSRAEAGSTFSQLFDRYHGSVFRFFERRGFTASECEDLTQETFIRVYRGLDDFRGESRLETWLFQIAANVYRQILRQRSAGKRAGREIPLNDRVKDGDSAGGAVKDELMDREPGSLRNLLAREQVAALRRALGGLPPQMRNCFWLRAFHELSNQEIASTLRISVQAVKVQLWRARGRLKKELSTCFGELDF